MKKALTSKNIFFSLLTLVFICLFISLGTWQINRGILKQNMLELESANEQSPAISNSTLLNKAILNPHHYQYRQAELQGYFDNQHHFLLDNQIHKGQVGYHVL